jgi:hypothetical protein
MKHLSDQEIQKLLDEQDYHKLDDTSDDVVKSYQMVFEALKESPGGGLPLSFADKVARIAVLQAERRQQRRFWLLLLFTILIALPLTLTLLFMYQPAVTQQFITYIFSHRWIALFVLLMFGLIQFADHWLLGRKGLTN